MDDNEYGKITVSENEDGKAVWEFEGLVTSDVPLDTDAQDFAGAINELYDSGSKTISEAEFADSENSFIITYDDKTTSTFTLTVENDRVTAISKDGKPIIKFINWKI